MKKSELKEIIKMALSEGDNYYEDVFESVVNEATAVVDTDDPKSPILKKLLKKHKVTMVAAPGFGKFKLTGSRKGLEAVLQSEDGWGINDLHNYIEDSVVNESEATEVFTDAELDMASEMLMDMFDRLGLENNVEKSDALVKYINGWFETNDFVNEAEEEDVEDTEEDIDVDVEGDIDLADVEPEASGDEGDIQSNLQAALQAAKAMGDQKLVDQIGNTITFFTRTHIVGDGGSVEEIELKEGYTRMQKLAGLIK